MKCFSQMFSCCSSTLELLGLYEPELTMREAKERLEEEGLNRWEEVQHDRNQQWNSFQNFQANRELPLLIKKAFSMNRSIQESQKGIAVDLGCGLSNTAIDLLKKGWKVYAVDKSSLVLKTLAKKVLEINKSWIKNGQLVLVNSSIEDFEYPEKVDLITAYDSLPYCDPRKIQGTFLKVKNALKHQGVFACNFFPYDRPEVDATLRTMFGAWLTTKNVVEAVTKSIDFSEWSVVEGRSTNGFARQFHVFARA